MQRDQLSRVSGKPLTEMNHLLIAAFAEHLVDMNVNNQF